MIFHHSVDLVKIQIMIVYNKQYSIGTLSYNIIKWNTYRLIKVTSREGPRICTTYTKKPNTVHKVGGFEIGLIAIDLKIFILALLIEDHSSYKPPSIDKIQCII